MNTRERNLGLSANAADLGISVGCRINRREQNVVCTKKQESRRLGLGDQTDEETRNLMTDIALNELSGHLPNRDEIYDLSAIFLGSLTGPEVRIATVLDWFSPEVFAETWFPADLEGIPVGFALLRLAEAEHVIRLVRKGERWRRPGSRMGVSRDDDFLK